MKMRPKTTRKMMSARANHVIAVAESSGSSQRALRPRAPAADKILVSPFANGDDMEYSGKDAHHLQMFLHHIKENKSELLNMLKWKVPNQESSLKKLKQTMKELSKRCHQFKMSSISDLPRTADFELWNQANCDAHMIEAMMSLVYKLTIRDGAILANRRKHETYGEVMPAQLAQFCQKLNMGPDDVFLDLGSGIGNTLCYVAGSCRIIKAVGIKLLDAPENFKEVMAFHGKKNSPIDFGGNGNLYQDGLRGATRQEVFEGFPNNTSWTAQPVKFFLLDIVFIFMI